ncbi:phospholipase D-like domain-containing protein [Reichenbachiella sp.]|uniref:phospholipase D-like domain-containing protein n=1 Tax=Reichenbachiella sp. TaxID=2184521 RepID=UPI003298272F
MTSFKHIINLGDVLRHQLTKASKFYAATALMKEYGQEMLDKTSESCEVRLLLGIDLPTPLNVLEHLNNKPSIELRVFDDDGKTFHPKVYLLQIDDEWHAYVGSANFTKGGFESNVEMTLAAVDSELTEQLLTWFQNEFENGHVIDEKWLNKYKNYLTEVNELDKRKRQLLKDFKKSRQKTSENDPLVKYDFTGQFFQYEHHNAFSGNKPRERNDSGVIDERLEVKRRLLDLHDLVWPEIKAKSWNLNYHYDSNHIVSSHFHSQGTGDELHALWLSYNRPKKEFQKLDPNSTPLFQMRMQVLVRHLNVAIHLTVGKDGGGYFERKNIYDKLRRHDSSFLESFHGLLTNLPSSFYINVANDQRGVHSVKKDELPDYLLKDDTDRYYFLFGKAYAPDDHNISEQNIVATVMQDFSKLMPIYELLKVPVL